MKQQKYWPFTSILKSTGNAFTAKPGPIFSEDAQEKAKMNAHQKRVDILRTQTSQITIGPRYKGEIPNALKGARSK